MSASTPSNLPNSSNSPNQLHIGIMSGTSMDGIDGVLAEFDRSGRPKLLGFVAHPLRDDLKDQLMSLQMPGENEIHREALAGNALALAYAAVVEDLLKQCALKSEQISSIGAHGQTIRHQPQVQDGIGYTKQTLNPALLAEQTKIDVIADFRSRDIAAQGQGAPLVPAFHASQFMEPNIARAILNIGGISNLTLLNTNDPNPDSDSVRGFDCGPGNVLMDLWANRHLDQAYDEDGAFARSGQVHNALFKVLISEPFLEMSPPKSTGRDLFNEAWLEHYLTKLKPGNLPLPNDIQATLTFFTAHCAITHLKKYLPNCSELLICGGGIRNTYLMETLRSLANEHFKNLRIRSTSEFGIDPQIVEAMAFAWLAWAHKNQKPANLPAVTGAKGLRILGAKYPC